MVFTFTTGQGVAKQEVGSQGRRVAHTLRCLLCLLGMRIIASQFAVETGIITTPLKIDENCC